MGIGSAGQVTRGSGDTGAHGAHTAGTLLAAVYDQLRKLAQQRMAAERTGHTLSATSLVHEAYLRLAKSGQVKWSGKGEFFFAAAEAMRRILIEHARRRKQLKHGNGNVRRLPRNVLDLADGEDFERVLTLDDAVSRLEDVSPTGAAVVRLRFYAGLSVVETAESLGISASTVKREWTYARAWLARELEE
jgi:RNA polymerase sigma factor (TIGR02999 family)